MSYLVCVLFVYVTHCRSMQPLCCGSDRNAGRCHFSELTHTERQAASKLPYMICSASKAK